eukprot:COSAG02_NODE_112_length_35994_cov_12.152695_17_plen_161_part_00
MRCLASLVGDEETEATKKDRLDAKRRKQKDKIQEERDQAFRHVDAERPWYISLAHMPNHRLCIATESQQRILPRDDETTEPQDHWLNQDAIDGYGHLVGHAAFVDYGVRYAGLARARAGRRVEGARLDLAYDRIRGAALKSGGVIHSCMISTYYSTQIHP